MITGLGPGPGDMRVGDGGVPDDDLCVRVGDGGVPDNGVSVGELVRSGEGVRVGDCVRSGEGVGVGGVPDNGVRVGDCVRSGEGVGVSVGVGDGGVPDNAVGVEDGGSSGGWGIQSIVRVCDFELTLPALAQILLVIGQLLLSVSVIV
jgi:hypothetical protein